MKSYDTLQDLTTNQSTERLFGYSRVNHQLVLNLKGFSTLTGDSSALLGCSAINFSLRVKIS